MQNKQSCTFLEVSFMVILIVKVHYQPFAFPFNENGNTES